MRHDTRHRPSIVEVCGTQHGNKQRGVGDCCWTATIVIARRLPLITASSQEITAKKVNMKDGTAVECIGLKRV